MTKKAKCCGVEIGEVANNLRLISEPNRLRLICLLRQGPKCVCELQAVLNLKHNLICHHLKEITKTKIIVSQKKGGYTFYALDGKKYKKLLKDINLFLGGRSCSN